MEFSLYRAFFFRPSDHSLSLAFLLSTLVSPPTGMLETLCKDTPLAPPVRCKSHPKIGCAVRLFARPRGAPPYVCVDRLDLRELDRDRSSSIQLQLSPAKTSKLPRAGRHGRVGDRTNRDRESRNV